VQARTLANQQLHPKKFSAARQQQSVGKEIITHASDFFIPHLLKSSYVAREKILPDGPSHPAELSWGGYHARRKNLRKRPKD